MNKFAAVLVDVYEELRNVGRRSNGVPAISVIAAHLVLADEMREQLAKLSAEEQDLVSELMLAFKETEDEDSDVAARAHIHKEVQ